jgi:NAD(P)-dependent dehydrogenase (short-subunit alcohol dehydrogenase family)
MPVALVTGASRGFGAEIAHALAGRGWTLIVTGRDAAALRHAVGATPRVIQVPGDVAHPVHRDALAAEIGRLGRLDLLVNNASGLGPSPLPPLDRYPLDELASLFAVNTIAPLAIIQRVLPELTAAGGAIVNVSSDAAVEPYPGWGGYGATKAALDQLTRVLAAERPELRVYAFDPGDMRTEMHQAAFPGEDISDRPEPVTVVPALLRLVDERPPSGRYQASALVTA